MISFSCSHCGLKLKVKPEFAGRSSKCPTCKHPLVVPTPDKTEGHVPRGEIDGTPSSIAQAGVEGGVTLGQKSVQELLARQTKKGQRYIIQNEIARGGMGAVLLAFDSDIRREVAIKFMLDQADPKKKMRFIEEAQITGQLEHPNIPPVHEIGLDAQKRLFFSMKMVKGRSLKEVVDVLRENPKEAEKEYTLGRLLNIFVNVCNGMAYAHSRGVVHRDLKPANIMTGDFGEVYVMDWGLAKVLKGDGQVAAAPMATLASGASSLAPSAVSVSSSQSKPSSKVSTSREPEADLTQEGAIVGTPVYMPPEQAMGEIDQIDERSDIYSLGAILYEMLALVPPIDKEGGHLNILLRVCEGTITPPEVRVGQSSGIVTDTSQSSGTRLLSSLKAKLKQTMAETASKLRGTKPTVPWHISVELSAIAMKALAKEKKDRYQTVEELRKDIERFQEGRSVSAKEDTKKEMIWKFMKRNKGFSAGAASALLVLLFSLWFLFGAWRETNRVFAAYQKEQQDKQAQGKKSVSAFVKAARLSAQQSEFNDALAQVDVALGFDEDYADAHLLRGQLLISEQEFPSALKSLEGYLKLKPGDQQAKTLAELCRKAKPDSPGALLSLADELGRQKAFTLADRLTRSAEKFIGSKKDLLVHYQKRIESAWPGLGKFMTMDAEGRFALDFANCKQVADLSPLQGIPLTNLSLYDCGQVKDLSPLKGMPLTHLTLANCVQLQDFSPLKATKLTNLSLYGCSQIKDLSLLQGIALTNLDLTHCNQVQDLSPLKGMPLTSLIFGGCVQIKDLSPLKGMPLTVLDLQSCGQVKDLSPLKEIPLTSLDLRGSGVQDVTPLQGMKLAVVLLTPKNITKGMDVLRQMTSLKTISSDGIRRYPPSEFWTKYDAGEFNK